MNVQALKDLLHEVESDKALNIQEHDKSKRKCKYKVAFKNLIGCANKWDPKHVWKTIFTSSYYKIDDPRIIEAALTSLSKKQFNKLELTLEQLRSITFEVDSDHFQGPEYSTLTGDSRYLTMPKEEVEIQKALGIKDPWPIRIITTFESLV